jgi:hypothetical protein
MRVTSGPDSPNLGSDDAFALTDCAATGVMDTDVATAVMLIDTAAAMIALRMIPAFMYCSLDLLV